MVEPEKFGHLHLVYHFAVPLRCLFQSLDFSIIALLSSLFMNGAWLPLTVLDFKGACFPNVLYMFVSVHFH